MPLPLKTRLSRCCSPHCLSAPADTNEFKRARKARLQQRRSRAVRLLKRQEENQRSCTQNASCRQSEPVSCLATRALSSVRGDRKMPADEAVFACITHALDGYLASVTPLGPDSMPTPPQTRRKLVSTPRPQNNSQGTTSKTKIGTGTKNRSNFLNLENFLNS